jgi:hypothetical protein
VAILEIKCFIMANLFLFKTGNFLTEYSFIKIVFTKMKKISHQKNLMATIGSKM